MTAPSVPNPSISNSETADVTKLTANDNAIISALTDGTKDLSVNQVTLAGQTLGAAGAVGTPSYAFASDTNTGIYLIGGDNIGIAVGGVKAFDINSAGVISMPKQSCAIVTLGTTQSNITDNTDTKVLLDTEKYDALGEFASNKFTATYTGYYLVTACIRWTGTIADKRYGVKVFVNGAETASSILLTEATGSITPSLSVILPLAATDYVELYAWHNDGTNTPDISGHATFYYTSLGIIKLA